jgi:hypothetical protein
MCTVYQPILDESARHRGEDEYDFEEVILPRYGILRSCQNYQRTWDTIQTEIKKVEELSSGDDRGAGETRGCESWSRRAFQEAEAAKTTVRATEVSLDEVNLLFRNLDEFLGLNGGPSLAQQTKNSPTNYLSRYTGSRGFWNRSREDDKGIQTSS